ncbi:MULTISPECIES: hypothetical protein [Desulfovibrio]|uniref:hypothetical protein n=1 Tax=Desulfovibrio TaxID=872 RepID=UPI0026E93976|nr:MULTISPECIES: hypothetical protein [Desulfovibrio]MCI7616959.1 hypothetical protein [Desulfovibrio piger]MDY4808332.1 hypothetical protein [Desulfovibrio sp.]
MYQQRGIAEKALWEEVKDACEYIDMLEGKNRALERERAEHNTEMIRRMDIISKQADKIRISENIIIDLKEKLAAKEAELEKARQAEGVNPRSRNTYLKVIAALANRNGKVDLHERGAAVTISRATENFGFPVSEDTTRKIIKEIEELQK